MEAKIFGTHRLYTSEIRCKRCKRLLMKGEIKDIEIKCPKCGYIQWHKEKGGEHLKPKTTGQKAVT